MIIAVKTLRETFAMASSPYTDEAGLYVVAEIRSSAAEETALSADLAELRGRFGEFLNRGFEARPDAANL